MLYIAPLNQQEIKFNLTEDEAARVRVQQIKHPEKKFYEHVNYVRGKHVTSYENKAEHTLCKSIPNFDPN